MEPYFKNVKELPLQYSSEGGWNKVKGEWVQALDLVLSNLNHEYEATNDIQKKFKLSEVFGEVPKVVEHCLREIEFDFGLGTFDGQSMQKQYTEYIMAIIGKLLKRCGVMLQQQNEALLNKILQLLPLDPVSSISANEMRLKLELISMSSWSSFVSTCMSLCGKASFSWPKLREKLAKKVFTVFQLIVLAPEKTLGKKMGGNQLGAQKAQSDIVRFSQGLGCDVVASRRLLATTLLDILKDYSKACKEANHDGPIGALRVTSTLTIVRYLLRTNVDAISPEIALPLLEGVLSVLAIGGETGSSIFKKRHLVTMRADLYQTSTVILNIVQKITDVMLMPLVCAFHAMVWQQALVDVDQFLGIGGEAGSFLAPECHTVQQMKQKFHVCLQPLVISKSLEHPEDVLFNALVKAKSSAFKLIPVPSVSVTPANPLKPLNGLTRDELSAAKFATKQALGFLRDTRIHLKKCEKCGKISGCTSEENFAYMISLFDDVVFDDSMRDMKVFKMCQMLKADMPSKACKELQESYDNNSCRCNEGDEVLADPVPEQSGTVVGGDDEDDFYS